MTNVLRKTSFILIDIILVNIAFVLSIYLRMEDLPQELILQYSNTLVSHTIIFISILWLFKLYDSLWNYASIDELISVAIACTTASSFIYLYHSILNILYPRSIYLILIFISIALIGGLRFSYRLVRHIKNKIVKVQGKRALIVGAGDAGAIVVKELTKHTELKVIPVAMIDDDPIKQNKVIYGVKVVGFTKDIGKIVKKIAIEEIIIAMPSCTKSKIKEIINYSKETKCSIKILPGVYEFLDGTASIKHIRDVKIEDLLGREEVNLDVNLICEYLCDKVVLITGGAGSIGSELCRQMARYNPKQLILLDFNENGVFEMEYELKKRYPKLNLESLVGSIRDYPRIQSIFSEYRPHVVFHAAAHKHVPLMEKNPLEAVKNNVLGTKNLAQSASQFKVERFILISTDKAVNPSNVMGASKRAAELILQMTDMRSETKFASVRFGNVLGSNGSVIPIFKKQIAEGGPVTVTDPNMTRYFMTISEAVQLVIQAGSMVQGGEIFVLDMGEPVKILDLARDMIRLSGYEPDIDIPIKIVGMRPGEKLHEELFTTEEQLETTLHDKIFRGKTALNFNTLNKELRELEKVFKLDKRLFDFVKEIRQSVLVVK